jgi:anti-sigma-K factor RskA
MDIEAYIQSGIIESYVMGIANNDEVAEIEVLMKKEPAIKKAVTDFEISFEKQMRANELRQPFLTTKENIFAEVAKLEQPLPKAAKVVSINWSKITAVAASALLCISLYFNYAQNKKNNEQANLIASVQQNTEKSLPASQFAVMKDPTITPVALYGVSYHAICRCTMFWDKDKGKAYLMLHHLPNSDESSDYQLWAIVNGKPVSLGIIDDSVRDRFIEISNVPQEATTFKVTLENAGGGSMPSEDTYVKGAII